MYVDDNTNNKIKYGANACNMLTSLLQYFIKQKCWLKTSTKPADATKTVCMNKCAEYSDNYCCIFGIAYS